MAPATINLRLAAVRRLAYEASDSGLLSPELVAGIRRVKGVKRLGQQVGNWLTVEEGQQLVGAVRTDTLRCKRDAAMLGLLLGCGSNQSACGPHSAAPRQPQPFRAGDLRQLNARYGSDPLVDNRVRGGAGADVYCLCHILLGPPRRTRAPCIGR